MLSESNLEQQLAEARAALRDARRSTSKAEPPPTTTAEAANGLVKVTLGTDGRLSAIEIDPKALRSGSEDLATELRTAVNKALDQRNKTAHTDEPMPDLEAINATIERLQDQSIRQMREISTAISETMRKLTGSR